MFNAITRKYVHDAQQSIARHSSRAANPFAHGRSWSALPSPRRRSRRDRIARYGARLHYRWDKPRGDAARTSSGALTLTGVAFLSPREPHMPALTPTCATNGRRRRAPGRADLRDPSGRPPLHQPAESFLVQDPRDHRELAESRSDDRGSGVRPSTSSDSSSGPMNAVTRTPNACCRDRRQPDRARSRAGSMPRCRRCPDDGVERAPA